MSEENKFKGTWSLEGGDGDVFTYTFDGNTVKYLRISDDLTKIFKWKGSFSFTNTEITFTPTKSEPDLNLSAWTQEYEFLENPDSFRLFKKEGTDELEGEFIKTDP